jgi:hypothetical protein
VRVGPPLPGADQNRELPGLDIKDVPYIRLQQKEAFLIFSMLKNKNI